MARKGKQRAYAYLRTSSKANVGDDKDSDKRQRAAIQSFAQAQGYEIAAEFYDKAVKGSDPVVARPGFSEMLAAIAGDGVRVILIESPDRFARDLTVQLTGHDHLKGLGVTLIPTTAPDHFTEDTPTAKMVRSVLGAIAEFEKATLVAKLKAARDRKRERTGRCEGRQSHAHLRPEVVALAKQLRRRRPKGGQRSLREIAADLEAQGHLNERGARYSPASINNMLAQPIKQTTGAPQ
jgi:DNA invertase Pin-like site-specific DNA recombinase